MLAGFSPLGQSISTQDIFKIQDVSSLQTDVIEHYAPVTLLY